MTAFESTGSAIGHEKLPFAVRIASWSFRGQRARYYDHVAQLIEASKGGTKLLTIFQKDEERYAGEPRGALSEWWAEQFTANGGNLADALAGTLPEDEVTILRVSQDAGPGALQQGLRDIARIANLTDRIRKEVFSTMAAATAGIVIGLLMLTVYAVYAAGQLQRIFGFVPVEFWGGTGKALVDHAAMVSTWGLPALAAAVVFGVYVYWTFGNLVGDKREWLDTRLSIYRAYRDIKGALFLATMATLTRRRGGQNATLNESLATFAQGARGRWLRWRIDQILNGLEQGGGIDAEVFETNLLSREMYFFLRDMQESRGLAEAFAETGRYVEEQIVPAIARRLNVLRWVMLIAGVACAASVTFWQTAAIFEMKDAMETYYSSK